MFYGVLAVFQRQIKTTQSTDANEMMHTFCNGGFIQSTHHRNITGKWPATQEVPVFVVWIAVVC